MATYYVDATKADDSGDGTTTGTAKKTVAAGLALMSGGDILYVKASGTYTITAAIAPPAGTSAAVPTRVIGYTTTPGDGGQATLTTASAIKVIDTANSYIIIANFIVDSNDVSDYSIRMGGQYNHVVNCAVTKYTSIGIALTATSSYAWYCRAYSGKASSTGGFYNDIAPVGYIGCVAHDNPGRGFYLYSSALMYKCVADTNASDGLYHYGVYGAQVIDSIFYKNSGDGIELYSANSLDSSIVLGCIFDQNGGYGLKCQADMSALVGLRLFDYNAYYNNTSGARSNAITGAHDVTLTGSPFTNGDSQDFSLNATAGAGAACRSVGWPGTLPGLSTPVGYADIGVFRHQDPTSSGSSPRFGDMTGGKR